MILKEAIIRVGNVMGAVIGRSKTIDGICRRASDIYPAKIEANDYDIIVLLEAIENQRDTVFLDEFLAAPGC